MVLFKCSVLGHQIYGVLNFYAATKWAVTALSEGLRKELAKKGSSIRVTVIIFVFHISKVYKVKPIMHLCGLWLYFNSKLVLVVLKHSFCILRLVKRTPGKQKNFTVK